MIGDTYSTISEINKMLRERKATVRELVLAYLKRIAAIDSCEGGLKSVIEINPDALAIAAALDRQMPANADIPPLYGVPVLLKDNINTKDRMRTSAGSVALADNYAPFDAPIAAALRRAGAVIIGKTNMTEFANYMSWEKMPSGYSSRGGQVINPFNRALDPSGSSSGSAVAVAAGLCAVAVGTETSGSIISPGGANGNVGIKPTNGLLSGAGILPISSTLDTAGPMARNVSDAAILLTAMADNGVDYTQFLEGADLSGVKIGFNREKEIENFKGNQEEIAAFDRLCGLLESAGAVLIDGIAHENKFNTRVTIMHYEFKACLNYYLSVAASSKMRSLADIIQFNQANAATALKYGQAQLLDAQNNASGNLTETAYLEDMFERERAITAFDKLFSDNDVDVMLGVAFAYTAPYTGFAGMVLPTSQLSDTKAPTKAHFTARPYDEACLIKVGFAAEKLLDVKLRPEVETNDKI